MLKTLLMLWMLYSVTTLGNCTNKEEPVNTLENPDYEEPVNSLDNADDENQDETPSRKSKPKRKKVSNKKTQESQQKWFF
jgi:hypothetical protein